MGPSGRIGIGMFNKVLEAKFLSQRVLKSEKYKQVPIIEMSSKRVSP